VTTPPTRGRLEFTASPTAPHKKANCGACLFQQQVSFTL
jgi:hypothetical protein